MAISRDDHMQTSFSFTATPEIIFGPGACSEAAMKVAGYGRKLLLVTGGESHTRSEHFGRFLRDLENAGIEYSQVRVRSEPSPELVDKAVKEHRTGGIEVVLAWGGGSAMDAGKAIAAMLVKKGPLCDYLEGVGSIVYDGERLPFIAVPTTAGTGSEATNNAVISRIGRNGFKRSLRHKHLMPDLAIVDPLLTLSCPHQATASGGMDAFTQLLEAYVSSGASPFTDTLCESALPGVIFWLPRLLNSEADSVEGRTALSYAALVSGLALANANLGAVHGMAGPMGGLFAIPHGAACGTLLAPVTEKTLEKLFLENPGHPAIKKYAHVGHLLADRSQIDTITACHLLVEGLYRWSTNFAMPRLSEYGIGAHDLDAITAASSNKNNPVALERGEMRAILAQRL